MPSITKNPGPLLTSEIIGGVSLVPDEFRAQVPLVITNQENPVDVEPDDPAMDKTGLLLESRVTQTRTDERKKTNSFLKSKILTSLVSSVKLRDGQIGTLTRSLVPVGTVLPVDATTEEASQKNLGTGEMVQEVLEAPTVFPAAVYGVHIPDVIPEEFRVAVPTQNTEITAAGQANTSPVLGTGELVHEESNVDIWKKRTKSVFRSSVAVPVTLNDSLFAGPVGAAEFASTVTKANTLDNGQQSILTGFLVLRSNVKNLGNNQSLREAETIDAFPTLTDNLMDRKTGIISNKVKTIVATGTANPAGSEQITLDKFRTLRTTETVDPTSLASISWNFPGVTNMQVPTELTSITVYQEGNAGAGNYNESGSYALTAHGSGGVALRGHAQGSATALYEVGYTVKEAWGENVPCTHVLFFAASTSTRASLISRISTIMAITVNDWPIFKPQGIVVVVNGGKSNVQLELSAVAHDVTIADFNGVVQLSASARTNGGGSSLDFGAATKAVRIPPTIHGLINVSGGNSFTESYASSSSIGTGVNTTTGTISGSATANVLTTSFPATAGQSTIPTSGSFVHKLNAEPYLPGTIMVHAEVIDFANVG